MESLIYALVQNMHEKFMMSYDGPPRKLDAEEREFRIACLREELEEYVNAKTLVEEYDAILDLIVFAVGTLYRQGLPMLRAYQVVMACNLSKVPGPNAKRGNFAQDLVKPDSFIGPENFLQKTINDLELRHVR